MPFFAEAALRIAGAIVFATMAFSIWNIGTRSPGTFLADVRHARGDARAIATGLLRAVVGVIFVAAGAVLLLPAVANPEINFAAVELFTLLVALGLEHLVGADLRAAFRADEAARR